MFRSGGDNSAPVCDIYVTARDVTSYWLAGYAIKSSKKAYLLLTAYVQWLVAVLEDLIVAR